MTNADIDLVLPKGSGVPREDSFELRELRRVFGDRLSATSLCLPRSQIGDLGAGNVIDVAAAVLAVNCGRAPSATLSRPVKNALCCSFSDNGQNAAVVFKSFDPSRNLY